MSTQHLESDTANQADLDDFLTPDNSAQEKAEPPADVATVDQDDTWENVNAKIKPKAEDAIDPVEELKKLRAEIEQERKEKANFEKRMKDSQRAFKDRTEEIKRLKAEIESAKPKTQQLKEDLASGDIAAPTTKKEIAQLAKEYGLTAEETEFFEIYPEGMNAIEKILAKRLEAGLSEREKQKQLKEKEVRVQQLEAEANSEEEAKWMSGVKAAHKDAEKLIANEEFKAWLEANDALRRTILAGKTKYDPSGLVEIIDHFKEQKAEIDRVRAKRQFNRQSASTPKTVHTSTDDSSKEKSWAQLNAELKKRQSR